METNLDYGFYEIWYGSLVLYGYYLASNLGFVRISSITKDVLKLGLLKPHMVQYSYKILSFKLDSWVN